MKPARWVLVGLMSCLMHVVASAQDSGRTGTKPIQVVPGSCQAPVYPDSLKAARVSGAVTFRAVVGADGVLEPGSIQIVRSTNRLFEIPATNAFRSCKLLPALVDGMPVRQIVEQVVRFEPPKRADSISRRSARAM